MPLLYFLTGALNFFNYLALSSITSDTTAFLSTLFLFSSSLVLEALSLPFDNPNTYSQSQKTKFTVICEYGLYLIGILGWTIIITNYIGYLKCELLPDGISTDFVIQAEGLLSFPPINIKFWLNTAGFASALLQGLLGARLLTIKKVRADTYNLKNGYWGK